MKLTDTPPSSKKKPRRLWLYRLIAITFGLTLAWLLLEILLRVAHPALPYTLQAMLRHVSLTPFTQERILPEQIWQEDRNFQFISRSGVVDERQYPDARIGFTVTTKAMPDPDSYVGFRVPHSEWEPRWPVDAVVVGDSFSFCYTEYNDCWVYGLETDHGLSVVNMSQVATGSISHLHILTTFGAIYEPPLVIWQWYGNDFNDDYGLAKLRGEVSIEPDPTSPAPQIRNSPFQEWLRSNSAVYTFLQAFFLPEEKLSSYTVFEDPYKTIEGDLAFKFGRPYILEALNMDNPKNMYGWERTKVAILDAQKLLGNDSTLVVVLIPTKEEVYGHLTEPLLGSEQLAALGEGRRLMLAFCEEENLFCLDTTSELVSAAKRGQLLYFFDDPHLNPQGNAIVESTVWKYLVDQDLSD